MTFPAKYSGRCGECARPIRVGQEIVRLTETTYVMHYERHVKCDYAHAKCRSAND